MEVMGLLHSPSALVFGHIFVTVTMSHIGAEE